MKFLSQVSVLLICVFLLSACVTQSVFEDEIHKRDVQISSLESEVEKNESRLVKHEEMIADISDTSKEALNRAQEAGMLAQGKFLYEIQLTDDRCKFSINEIELGDECKGVLDEFIERVKADDRNVYIEIQGHTDSSGDADVNYLIGKKRAEAVYTYLATRGGFPLHKMNVISYGESQLISDETTLEGRLSNRRVNIIVLQ